MSFNKTVLDNGITVISEHMDSVRTIALGVWFQVGSRDETPEEAGMSHFMEHMMFKGTSTYSARELSEAFDRLGARQNAFTSKEVTCYYADFIDESLPGVFGLIADMVTDAALEQSACELEREVVIEEIARSEDDPEDIAHELFSRLAWPNHNLGLSIAGTRKTVGGFDHDAAVEFRSKHYFTGNCIVAAAGNVDHTQLVALAERLLSGLPHQGSAPQRIAPQESTPALEFKYKDTEQAHMFIGTSTMGTTDERRFALSLASSILGGSMSSRLFQEVRERLGLVYSIYSFPQLFSDGGLFAVYAGTRPDNAQKVYDKINSEMERFGQSDITADELELARQSARGHLALSLESTSRRMMRLAEAMISGNPILSFDESLERLASVTLDDVHTIAGDIAHSEPTIAIVGPFKQQSFSLEG